MRAPFSLVITGLAALAVLAMACNHADGSEVRIAATQTPPPVAVARAQDPPSMPVTAPPPAERRHVVAPGETIHGVAAQYGISAAALVYVNGLRGSRLEPGRELTIPEGDPRPPIPPQEPLAGATLIDRGQSGRRAVALTFDAGADRGYAVLILDVLRDHGVRASFGMTGAWARQNPDLVQRMASEGHRFINHTWNHGSFTGFSPGTRPLGREERWSQLDRTDALLVELTGQTSRPFFRSPYGDTDASVQRDIAARGYAYNVLWTVDSGGWRGIPARSIVDICLSGARPDAIYVFHVGADSQDALALAPILESLTDAGYDFETIDEIVSE